MNSPMSSKQRFLTALQRKRPDRLPVTTHHLMPSFLQTHMEGMSNQEFFDFLGLDPILWLSALKPDESRNEYLDPLRDKQKDPGMPHFCSDNWQIRTEKIAHPRNRVFRYRIFTPERTLSMVLENDAHTSWVSERLIKAKSDVGIFNRYAPRPVCDVDEVVSRAGDYGERGLVRGSVPGFDIYGQPGCWQDAASLFGIENLILAAFDDPHWVHSFLLVLMDRKKHFIRSLSGAPFDLIELGGGDGSSTVISPKIFNEFIAPYDAELIEEAHRVGQRIVYHTCGGMMPLLEAIAGMKPDAMETFTPPSLGGDVDLKEAKRRIGRRVCLIGGFDQFRFLKGNTPDETRKAVLRCFEEAGEDGGYILSPSDHFFEAELRLLQAFAAAARECVY